jgi:hypothetical protein
MIISVLVVSFNLSFIVAVVILVSSRFAISFINSLHNFIVYKSFCLDIAPNLF